MQEKDGFGIASFVLGLLGLLIPFIGIFFSIVAIIFYFQQKKNGKTGLATAGLVLGIIGIVITLIFALFLLFFSFLVIEGNVEIDSDFSNKTLETLIVSPPFSAEYVAVNNQGVDIALVNDDDSSLTVKEVLINVQEPSEAICMSDSLDLTLGVGETQNLSISCTGLQQINVGDSFIGDIVITFRFGNANFDSVSTGYVSTTVN